MASNDEEHCESKKATYEEYPLSTISPTDTGEPGCEPSYSVGDNGTSCLGESMSVTRHGIQNETKIPFSNTNRTTFTVLFHLL